MVKFLLIFDGARSVNKTFVALLFWCGLTVVSGQPGKCDQQPEGAGPPTDASKSPYYLDIGTQKFLEDQTYVLTLGTHDLSRPFKRFMITVEDPAVDNNTFAFNHQNIDVGTLKTLEEDLTSQYSEKCFSSVENKDISDKLKVTMHWVSPKKAEKGKKVRIRAMVAENQEVWYTGGRLNVTLQKDDKKLADSLPIPFNPKCSLCSEARYEILFKGQWSRGTHPLHYPSKPDDNKYSHMVGASHDETYVLWEKGALASDGLRELAERANITGLEIEILEAIKEDKARTLIKGKMHQHPHMSEPSQALFRVDKKHHLFSVVVAIKPSPDWFLGTHKYELCDVNGWQDHYEFPLFPWDAGTLDGISYESATSVTAPMDTVQRVAVGSFDKESPFYQMNLNDLKPFAILEVTKLDEYPLSDCDDEHVQDDASEEEEANGEEESEDEPRVEPSIQRFGCPEGVGEWSPCKPATGSCGLGIRTRVRYTSLPGYFHSYDPEDLQVRPLASCHEEMETQPCFERC